MNLAASTISFSSRMTVPKPCSADSAVAGKDDYGDNHSSIEKTLLKEIKRGAHMEGETKPWLMYLSGKDQKNITFCSISDPTKSYSTKIPELMTSRTRLELCSVQHGWFVWQNIISKDVSSFFLWNPLNLKKIMLPPLNHNGTIICSCIMSSSPPTTNYEPCSLYLFPLRSPSIFYYQFGDKQWTKVCLYKDIVRDLARQGRDPLEEKSTTFYNPVYWNGCLYAGVMTQSHPITVAIEKLQPNGSFSINCILNLPSLKYLSPFPGCWDKALSHLIESNNALLKIVIFHALNKVTEVCVYKFDCSQRVWEKLEENIKDRVFFISNGSAFSCQTINPEVEGGRIYIALKNFNYVYIYNIKEKSLVTSPHFSNLPEDLSYSRWFMPDSEMTGTLKEEIGKSHQVREKESTCDIVYLKDAGDKAHIDYALPIDVVEVIAKHLNDVLDYLQFRASNRLLRLASPPIQWRSSSSRFDDLSMCPLFVFPKKDKVFTFVHPKHGIEFKNVIKYPHGKQWNMNCEICCSKDGWLLLVAVNGNFQVFFNPFTKEVLPLPSHHNEIRNIRCVGMSHSPTSSECVTVELVTRNPIIFTALTYFLWESCYRYLQFCGKKFPLYNTSPAFHNGLFYFLSTTGKLGIIEATREKASWKVLEELQAPCSTCFNNFLVECDGNLLSIFETPFAKGVYVFKLNESTMTWTRVESLKNHMLFVGKTSFSVVANIPGMENKIYFPRFYGQSIVFYSLETNNYHTFQNDEVVNFHNVREHLSGSWIQPRWH